ncbi:DUF4199 domain-containing protein [Sphingobacteriaceae bacterium WQ 2009]|uniref:DUF4199 domain-containing protein n=1 Tax=Rhinopithecimicrobium faecis TaxID=2820698 RepID=A0A8T4HDX0_9SPHI|nr:DUF4199 domain-containing protein [Sphingobacteriaceae bacterium WQ 2009]
MATSLQEELNRTDAGFNAIFNKKDGIIFGIILGVISFILGLIVLYLVKDFKSFWAVMSTSIIVNTGIYVVVAAILAFFLRKRVGDYWSFSVALKTIYVMLAISTLISTTGTQALVNFVYPTLQEEVLNNTINVTIEYMEKSNLPDDQIDGKIAELEVQRDSIGKLTFGQFFKGMAITLVVQFIFALMLSAIFKREKPMFRKASENE